MHTSAFALLKHDLGLSVVELSTPPLAAAEMAEWLGEVRNMQVHNLDTDNWIVRACFGGTKCFIFIDAERPIPGNVFAEIIGDAVSDIIGTKIEMVKMPARNATKH